MSMSDNYVKVTYAINRYVNGRCVNVRHVNCRYVNVGRVLMSRLDCVSGTDLNTKTVEHNMTLTNEHSAT